MAVTPAPLTDAVPLMQAPPNQALGQNNILDIRRGLITPLILPTSNEVVARQGVLARAWDGAAVLSMKVYSNTTADRNIRISGGSCVITRTGEGAYLVHMVTGTTTILCDPADATNPVVEAVVVRLYDRNISADTGAALHGPYYDVIRGVPGATINLAGTPGTAGAPPALPDGTLLLAYLTRAAGTAGDVIGNATNPITDKRKSTSLHGTPRVLLPGDAATDPGIVIGEERYRIVNNKALPVEYWDGATWRGTQPIVYPKPTFTAIPPGTGHLGGNATATLAAVTVPDPGWPYRLEISAGALVIQDPWATDPLAGVYLQLNLDDQAFTPGNPTTLLYRYTNTYGTPMQLAIPSHVYPKNGSAYSGQHTVYLIIRNESAPSRFLSVADNEYSQLTVKVVPA